MCDRVVNEKLESEMECISMSEKVWFTSCTRSFLTCERLWGLRADLVCVHSPTRNDGMLRVVVCFSDIDALGQAT